MENSMAYCFYNNRLWIIEGIEQVAFNELDDDSKKLLIETTGRIGTFTGFGCPIPYLDPIENKE